MNLCAFCGWQGDDVQEVFLGSKKSASVCMSCATAIDVHNQSNKLVGKMHPVSLVPIIRSCVAQSVGSIVASIVDHISQIPTREELSEVVKKLQEKGSIDPN